MLAPPSAPWGLLLPLLVLPSPAESCLSLFMGGGEHPPTSSTMSSSSSSSPRSRTIRSFRSCCCCCCCCCSFSFCCRLSSFTAADTAEAALASPGGGAGLPPPRPSLLLSAWLALATTLSRSASRTAWRALACCSAIARPTSIGGIPGMSRSGGGGRPAWLYILNSASRVISRAERGLPGFPPPGGDCFPPRGPSIKRVGDFKLKSFVFVAASFF